MNDLESKVLDLLVSVKKPVTTKEIAGRLKVDRKLIHSAVVALRQAGKIQFIGKDYGWQIRG
jgi:predicted transcriptional regulator